MISNNFLLSSTEKVGWKSIGVTPTLVTPLLRAIFSTFPPGFYKEQGSIKF